MWNGTPLPVWDICSWCSGSSINSGDSSYKIQAFYDDCEGTGRRYASLQHKVLVSQKTPLGIKEQESTKSGFSIIKIFIKNSVVASDMD